MALLGRTSERAAVRRWTGEACNGDLRILAITARTASASRGFWQWSQTKAWSEAPVPPEVFWLRKDSNPSGFWVLDPTDAAGVTV